MNSSQPESAFSHNERIKNYERGKKYMEKWPSIKPYAGPFTEIDLTLEWYCPRCCSKKHKLELSRERLSLYCNEHYEICEYSYSNAKERDRRRTFLSEGYEWPLSKLELVKRLIAMKQDEIVDCAKRQLALDQYIKNANEQLAELVEEGAQIQREML